MALKISQQCSKYCLYARCLWLCVGVRCKEMLRDAGSSTPIPLFLSVWVQFRQTAGASWQHQHCGELSFITYPPTHIPVSYRHLLTELSTNHHISSAASLYYFHNGLLVLHVLCSVSSFIKQLDLGYFSNQIAFSPNRIWCGRYILVLCLS